MSNTSRERANLNLVGQLSTVARMQLTNWRWAWRSMVVVGMLTPALWLIAMRFIRSGDDLPASATYLVAGNVVLALMFEVNNRTSGNLAFLKETGGLEFFLSLPVRPIVVVMGTVCAFSLLALPGSAVAIFLGSWILESPLNPNIPLLVLAVVLSATALAGLGATIGVLSRSNEEASSIALGSTLVLLFLGPVMVKASSLPDAVVWIGYVNPAAHAAVLLRQALFGVTDSAQIILSSTFLLLFGLVFQFLARSALLASVDQH